MAYKYTNAREFEGKIYIGKSSDQFRTVIDQGGTASLGRSADGSYDFYTGEVIYTDAEGEPVQSGYELRYNTYGTYETAARLDINGVKYPSGYGDIAVSFRKQNNKSNFSASGYSWAISGSCFRYSNITNVPVSTQNLKTYGETGTVNYIISQDNMHAFVNQTGADGKVLCQILAGVNPQNGTILDNTGITLSDLTGAKHRIRYDGSTLVGDNSATLFNNDLVAIQNTTTGQITQASLKKDGVYFQSVSSGESCKMVADGLYLVDGAGNTCYLKFEGGKLLINGKEIATVEE